MGCEDVDWIQLAKDWEEGQALENTVIIFGVP
jgi:hypothetical protein